MKPKRVCFKYERCLDSNPQALKTCRAMVKQLFTIYIVTDLPKDEFGNKIIDFALDNNIYYRNIIFNNNQLKNDDFIKRYDLRLYFTDNEFEATAINKGITNPIACYMPYEKPLNWI